MARVEKPNRQTQETGPVLVADEPETAAEGSRDEFEPDAADESSENSDPPQSTDPRTAPKSDDLTPDELFKFIAQHPTPGDLDFYVYRLVPIIRKAKPVDWSSRRPWPTYVEKLKGLITPQTNRVVDLDWVRTMRGSGKYYIQVNDRSVKRTKNRELCHCTLEINDYQNHPAIFDDYSELLPVSENGWLYNRLLRDKIIKQTPEGNFVAYEDGEKKEQHTNGAAASIDPTHMLKQTVDLAKDLAKTMTPPTPPAAFSGADIVNLIGKTQTANDPEKIIAAARGLVEMTKPADSPMLALLMAQLEDARKEAAAAREREMRMLEKMLDKANTPPPAPPAAPAPVDPIKQMGDTLKMIGEAKETLGLSGGEGGSSKMNGWQEFLKEPLTELISGLKPLFGVGAQLIGMKAMQPQPGQQPARPAAPATTAPAPVQQPAPMQQQTPPEQQEPQQEMNIDPTTLGISIVISQANATLRAFFREGLSGTEFADEWFCNTEFAIRSYLPAQVPQAFRMMAPETMSGYKLLEQLQQTSGKDPQGNDIPAPEWGKQMILSIYRQQSEVWQSIAPNATEEQRFEKFIGELVAYKPPAQEDKS